MMELTPGATAALRRIFDQTDFDRFAALSGDDNPIHVDPAFAAATRFGRTVAHGMMLYSLICRALVEQLGPGFEQIEQELMFLTPTYAGEEVNVCLEAVSVDASAGTADIATNVIRPDGAFACQGRTLVALRGNASFDSVAPQIARRYSAHARLATDAGGAETYKGLRTGQSAQVARSFALADLQEYRDLTGDANPAFSDPAYAAAQGWPAPRIPGGLLGGLFSYLLGTRLPGRGTNWLKQRLTYPAPCFAGEEITARVEITRLRPEKDLVNLRGTCAAGGRLVCEGESLVLVKDLEDA